MYTNMPIFMHRLLVLPGLILIVISMGLLGCDSSTDPGPDPGDFEGTYVFEEFIFEIPGTAVRDLDFLEDVLVVSDNTPRMEFFGRNASVDIVYQFEDGRSRVAGVYSVSGGNQVRLDFSGASESDLQELLLPATFSFDVSSGAVRLEAELERTNVNLAQLYPEFYEGLSPVERGILKMRLRRVSENPAAFGYDE